MVERGLPIVDGAPACPFVAFDDDRDARATAPDHRHRCYAEARPAPRALAHQDAYCLSSSFPVCPTFQDWARREAAAARPTSRTDAATPPQPESPPERHPMPPPDRDVRHAPDMSSLPRRDPPQDRAAALPWTGGAAAMTHGDDATPFLAGGPRPEAPPEARGLAGSAADRMASGDDVDDRDTGVRDGYEDHRAYQPPVDRVERLDERGADRARSGQHEPAPARRLEEPIGSRQETHWSDPDAGDGDDYAPPPPPSRPERGHVDRARDRGGRGETPRERVPDDRRPSSGAELFGPAWERPRRNEAYPSLRSRVALPVPALSRVLVAALVLLVGVVVFFSLPAILGLGSGDTADRSPSPSLASPTATPSPTTPPAPTPQVYTVAQGDTLTRIAKKFGLTLDQLMAANPQIKNPNKIAIGDQITIPTPAPEDTLGAESPSTSPS